MVCHAAKIAKELMETGNKNRDIENIEIKEVVYKYGPYKLEKEVHQDGTVELKTVKMDIKELWTLGYYAGYHHERVRERDNVREIILPNGTKVIEYKTESDIIVIPRACGDEEEEFEEEELLEEEVEFEE